MSSSVIGNLQSVPRHPVPMTRTSLERENLRGGLSSQFSFVSQVRYRTRTDLTTIQIGPMGNRLRQFLMLTTCLLATVLAVVGMASNAHAQYYFGKNKVQYTDFEWQVLSTDKFDIYFYDSERELAEVAAEAAHDSYDYLSDRFNHEAKDRIPLIIYSSPRFFTQTNVIPSLLPENVAGFTEFFKGRVVLPFNGSYEDFRRVLQHELVHVFTFSKLSEVATKYKKMNIAQPPLWFTEGIAEFYSRPWESDAEMILSDLVLTGRFYNLERIDAIAGTYLMYKEGESFCHFIAETYGAEFLVYLLDNCWRGSDFWTVAAFTFGKTLEEVGKEWEYWLKKKYFPTIQTRELPDRALDAITERGYSVKPVPIRTIEGTDTTDHIVFKANRLGYAGIYMTTAGKGPDTRPVEVLLKGERSPRFESLHLLGSSLDVHDGKVIFSSQRHERDVLYELDVRTKGIVGEHRWDSIYNISSPHYSRDGKRIAFAGSMKDGLFNLYHLDLETKKLDKLTDDWYLDTDPVFTYDGDAIIFSSDRGEHGAKGWMNLFRYDLKTERISPYLTGPNNIRGPSFSPDGEWLAYTSDEDGILDVYRRHADGRRQKLTNIATGAFDPRFMPDGKSIVFAAYQNSGFQIFQATIPDSLPTELIAAESGTWAPAWTPEMASGELMKGAVKYERDFSFDIAQSAVSYDAFYGTVGGFQTALTDVLGDHQYFFLLANNADTKDEFLKSFNVAVSYFNREKRFNYGYGAYHLFDDYNDPVEGPREERQIGVAGYVGYPLSKFRRIEGSLFLRHSDKQSILFDDRKAVLATQFISLVHDNSLWDISGPIDGWRLMLTLGYTGDLSNMQSFNRIAIADARKYFRLGRFSAFAMRLMGHVSAGNEPQRRYLGGSWDLRGYPRRDVYARNVILSSNELRFPLIDALFVGLPVASLGFQAIRGAVFFDAGNAWEDDFGRLKGSMGVGARVSLGYLVVLRFDWARRTDFRTIDPKTRFEFFFGWNF